MSHIECARNTGDCVGIERGDAKLIQFDRHGLTI
jgi:hypothetical protein